MGTPLNDIWDSLNHQQRLSAARQIGQLLKELSSHRFPSAGKIRPQRFNQDSCLGRYGSGSRSGQSNLTANGDLIVL